MKIKIINSNSDGNCYILQPEIGKSIILEAGVNTAKVSKKINYKWSDIAGVFVTHEHKDHSEYIKQFQAHGVNVFATSGTKQALKNNQIKDIHYKEQINIANFSILPFATIHDAAQPCGFYIYHPEMGMLMFATDTAQITQKFAIINHLLIECNYDENNPSFNNVSDTHLERVRLSHQSLQQVIDYINVNADEKLQNIVLIHLSERNIDKAFAINRVKDIVENKKMAARVFLAEKDKEINLYNYTTPNF